MTRTRHARTVARLAIASMIALRNRILRPASSAVSAVMQATWLATAPIDREARTGAMMGPVADPWHGLAVAPVARPTPSTR